MADSAQPTGLMGIDPDLLMNMGFGLMSMGHYGTDPGKAMQGAMQNYYATKQAKQTLQMNQMNMQVLQSQMPQIQAFGNFLAQKMGKPQQGAQQQPQGQPQAAPQQPTTAASSVPTIPGAPTGFGSAPPIQAAPVSLMGGQQPPAGATPPSAGLMGQPQQAPQQPHQGGGLLGGMSVEDATQASILGAGLPFGMGDKAKALGEAAKLQLENDPAHATQMRAAGSDLSADQLLLQQALQRGDMPTAQMVATKMRIDAGTLHISRDGTRQELGADGQWRLVDPTQMTTGVGNSITPMQGATQTREALAAAIARGEAAGQVQEVKDVDGNSYWVPRSTLLAGGANARPNAAPTPPGAPSPGAAPRAPATGLPLAGIGPQRTTLLTDQAKSATEANTEYQKQAEDANTILAQANELRAAGADFTPGKFANTRGELLNLMNSAGLITDDEKKQLGSYQAGSKIAVQLQAAVTKALGSREAAQVFTYMKQSIPNLTLSPDGFEKILSWTEGMARYQQARAQTAQQRYNGGDVNGVNSTRDDFVSGTNPVYYILASASPAARGEMLSSMPHSQQLLAQWAKAVKNGLAPAPNEYWGGTASQGLINRGGQ